MPRLGIKRKKGVAFKPKLTRGLPVGSKITCADNSGAKILQIIGVIGYKGKHNRYPSASIGDMVSVTVKQGALKLRKQVMRAIIIRQRMPFKRPNGLHVTFEDNAGVLVDKEGKPLASEIRGPIAREAVERWPELSKISSIVV